MQIRTRKKNPQPSPTSSAPEPRLELVAPAPVDATRLEELRAIVGVAWLPDAVLAARPDPLLDRAGWRAWYAEHIACGAGCCYLPRSSSSRLCEVTHRSAS